MTDKTDPRPYRPKTQPLPFLPVSPAKLMLSEGVAQIWWDSTLVGAMFKAALQMWIHGPVDDRTMLRLIGCVPMNELMDAGVIVRDGDLLHIPWVEEARTESDRRRLANAEKGRKGAEARWEKPKDSSAMPKHIQSMADDASKERRGEERTEEDSSISSSPKKRGRKPSPINALWASLWAEFRGQTWAWKKTDAFKLAQLLTLADGDLGEIERRARVMFASKDIWVQQNASCGLLLARWNQYGVEIRPVTATEAALSGGSEAAQDLYARLKGVVGS